MAHIQTVLVPEKNRPDIGELSKEITKGLEIVFVSHMEEVIREAFVKEQADEAQKKEKEERGEEK